MTNTEFDKWIMTSNEDALVRLHPARLRFAAEIVRNELLKHEDWYDAMVQSISAYMIEKQGGKSVKEFAEGLANQLIGDERNGID